MIKTNGGLGGFLVFGIGFGIAAYGVNMLFGGHAKQTIQHVRAKPTNNANVIDCEKLAVQLQMCQSYPNADCSILENQLKQCKMRK